jgi:hypothetical protein
MNHEAVTARALDLHEKASMPLAQALELALSEATPSPIWPCAKLVIKDGQVSLLSHQYAPGLPDGEHDVYPLPVDSDAEPSGVGVPARTLPTRPFGIETALNMMRETRGGNEAKLWTPLCWDLACYIAELEAHVAAGVKEDRG